jgi:hypothetical protein
MGSQMMARLWKFDTVGTVLLAAAALFVMSAPAAAAPANVALVSVAQIERTETGTDGREHTIMKNPADVIIVPGDRVVFTLKYHNQGIEPANGFRATNPMPGPVQFISAAEDWAEVSVDGGKNWGKLGALTVQAKAPDGTSVTRAAAPEDVTHVRWVFASSIAPGSEGQVSYRGVIK